MSDLETLQNENYRLERELSAVTAELEKLLSEPSKMPGCPWWALGRLGEEIKALKGEPSFDTISTQTTKGVPYNSGEPNDGLCGFQRYDTDAYQTLAVSTVSKEPTDVNVRLGVFALGIAGEGGEVADHIKKFLGHGHELDKDKLIREVGDVMWYIAVLSHELGFKLTEVTSRNIEKLRKRYPNGFSVEASKNRKPGDV